MKNLVANFYKENPRMVSSPFGGIDGVNRKLFHDVFKRLDIELKDKRVLDVGCGRGFVGDIVREAGGEYTGVDFVKSRSGFRLALADAASLPFAKQSFDAVFCIDAYEHFPKPELAAREFRRVLRPGGFFYLSAPNYSNVAGVVKRVYEGLGWYEKNTWAPFGRWQAQELETPLTVSMVKRIFSDADFSSIRNVGHGEEVGLGLFPWVDHPSTPEAIQFRLQRLFKVISPPIAVAWPGASLHNFWKMEV